MFIRQMSYLVALSREKHFGRAAASCNVTQPTLSAGLKSLERELGMRLVLRNPRFSGLTAEGERVAAWAHHIIADYASLREDAVAYRKGLRGALRLAVIPAAMPLIARLTSTFTAKLPNATIDVLSLSSVEIQRGLDKFEIDAGVTYLENEPLIHVRKIALYRERYVFITKKSGAFGKKRSITWRQAARQNLCLLNETMQNRRVLNKLASSLQIELSPSVTTNSFLAVCSHVSSGGWSSIIPHTFAYIFRGCDDLVTIDLVEPVHEQMIGVVASDRDPLSPLAAAFLSCATAADTSFGAGIKIIV